MRQDIPSDSFVTISPRAAARLHGGHVWVYRSDLEEVHAAGGALARILDPRGRFLGAGLYSEHSKIALRLFARTEVHGRDTFLSLVRERMSQAIAWRRKSISASDAWRAVFGEADGLPGLIVDRYADVVVVQFVTQGADQIDFRETVVSRLVEELSPSAVIERCDARIRDLERMEHCADRLLYGELRSTIFTMNGLRFRFDSELTQKTGGFLDQRQNYMAAEKYGAGEGLDVCTYHGGFALHLNRVCSRVTGVDSSRPALEHAEQNEQLNRDLFGGREIEWIEADAFELLRDYSSAAYRYDIIVLDPPAFARNKRASESALSGYKELNLRAFKMLKPGGTLVTCSCSHHVSSDDFLAMLRSAAADAKREAWILEERTQSSDHPILLGVPETKYLKFAVIGCK